MEISEVKLQEYEDILRKHVYIKSYTFTTLDEGIKEILLDHEKIVRRQVIKELSARKNKTVNHNIKIKK